MGKLGSYKATRSLGKIGLEAGLKRVNDFYWGILASTRFSNDVSTAGQMRDFLSEQQDFKSQGRLRPDNINTLVAESQTELPKFAVILLFSYFEPYLRSLWTSALLGNPGIVADRSDSIDGESLAENKNLIATISVMCSPMVETLLKGPYVDRFRKARRLFGIPVAITDLHVQTLDDYYAKRNCLVHFQGRVASQSKKYFASDIRNEIGKDVVVDHSDFLRLHRAIHLVSDEVDTFMLEAHIRNSEILRLLYELREEHPEWRAKDFNRELLRRRFAARPSRNVISAVLEVPEK